jgi:hypothetical protein
MIQISPKLHFHLGTLRQIDGNLQIFLMQIFSTVIRETPWNHVSPMEKP